MKKYVLMTMLLTATAAQAEKLTWPKYAALVEKHVTIQQVVILIWSWLDTMPVKEPLISIAEFHLMLKLARM